jgi:hypothetical protein
MEAVEDDAEATGLHAPPVGEPHCPLSSMVEGKTVGIYPGNGQ